MDKEIDVNARQEETEVTDEGRPDTTESVGLKFVDAEAYHDIIARYQGQLIVVDFWATWCPPCVASFPKLVELHADYADKGVEVVAVSVDFPGEEEKVREFLEEHEAFFTNLKVDVENADEFISAVGQRWSGDIPAVFLYDRSGQLIEERFGSGAIDEIKNSINELLNQD